jgi:hypothetical protein
MNWKLMPFTATGQYYYFYSCHSYGGGKFRVYGSVPAIVYSTNDNWVTVDSGATVPYTLPGTMSDTAVAVLVAFGYSDTLVALGNYTLPGTRGIKHPILFQSWDGGRHWQPPLYTTFGVGMETSPGHDTVVIPDGLALAVSRNRGVSWSIDSFNFGFPPEPVPGHAFAIMPDGSILGLFYQNGVGDCLFATTRLPLDKVETYEWSIYGTHLYPNPATTTLNVISVNHDCPLHIYDVLGREALRGELSDAGTASLDVSRLPRGIYMVVLERTGSMIALGMLSLVE